MNIDKNDIGIPNIRSRRFFSRRQARSAAAFANKLRQARGRMAQGAWGKTGKRREEIEDRIQGFEGSSEDLKNKIINP